MRDAEGIAWPAMIAAHCPHDDACARTPDGPCARCVEAGVAVVLLASKALPGGVLFGSSPAEGLSTGEMRALLGTEAADEALVERKLAAEPEASLPYDEDPAAAEREAYEEALAWRINLGLSDVVGDEFGPAVLFVVPEAGRSWAREVLGADSREEIRRALLAQKSARWGPPFRTPVGALLMLFVAESHDVPKEA